MDLIKGKVKIITQQKSSGLLGIIWSLGHASRDVRSLDRKTQDRRELQLPHEAATVGHQEGPKVLWLT